MRRARPLLLPAIGLAALGASLLAPAGTPARAAEEAAAPAYTGYGFEGPLGTFNRPSLQRGFQVYEQACASCHALTHLRFADLSGTGLPPADVAAAASNAMVPGGFDANGMRVLRPGVPADQFPDPFPTEGAARAANAGADPLDLSLITRQRPGGAHYVAALIDGYRDVPPGVSVFGGRSWNTVFPGHQIAMAQPLHDGQMTFADGTKATVPQMAHDVATFLAWASDPSVEERRILGVQVVLFLAFLTLLTYLLKRRIWSAAPRD